MGLTTRASFDKLYNFTATVSPCSNSPVVVKASAGAVYQVEVDNTNNAGSAVYLRLFDSASATTITSDEPNNMWPVAAGQKLVMSTVDGLAFGGGIVVACTTVATLVGTAPTGTVVVRIGYT